MILLYHNVVPDTASPGHVYTSITLTRSSFERQVNWLADRFRILPLDEYLDYRQNSRKQFTKTLALTFDDGTASSFECVVPVLEQRRVPATFFIITGHLQGGELVWGAYLNALCFETVYDSLDVEDHTYSLDTPDQRRETRRRLAALARGSGDPVLYCRQLAVDYPLPHQVRASYQGMTYEQLRAAGERDLIEVGSHTITHPFLSELTKNQQAQEIFESQRQLSELSGKPVRYFAYPSGDYNQDTLELVMEAGYHAAFATIPRGLGNDPRFEIERIGIYSSSLLKLHAKALGVTRLARRFGLRTG